MTQPRHPEAAPEDEVTRPLTQEAPDTGNWRPVDEPSQEAEPPADHGATAVQPPALASDEEATVHVQATDDDAVEPAEAAAVTEPVDVSATEPTAVVSRPDDPDTSRTERLRLPDEPLPPPEPPADAIFRPATPTSGPSPEPTRMEPISEEERRLAAERAARREARTANLAATAPVALATPEPVVIHKRTNDKFWGALGLFLLRVVVAGIFAIRGLNILTDIPAAQAQFSQTIIPEPGIMAIVTGVAAELIALALLLGLLTRAAGLGVALIAAGALTFVYWGPWSPFVPGQPGFTGEYELLLATVGVLLLLLGGGGWSLDRSFRAGRERDKRERAAAAQ